MRSFPYNIENDRPYGAIDRLFLQSVLTIFEQKQGEPGFGLQQLSREMKMSKATLYRRIKSITGLSPTDFIRKTRMRKACNMLMNRTVNISETAYVTGFNDPKYFSRCFKEEFGLTPTEYKRSIKAV